MKSRQFLALAISGLVLIGLIVLSTQLFAQEATPEVTPPAEVTGEIPPALISTSTPSPNPLGNISETATWDMTALIQTATAYSTLYVPQIILPTEATPLPIELTNRPTIHPDFLRDPSTTVENYVLPDDPRNYRIAYLIAPDAVADTHFMSASGLFVQRSQAVVAETWADILRIDQEQPIDVFVLHQSAYSLVDLEWTAAAVRRGVVFALVNLYYNEMVELHNNTCGKQRAPFVPENPYASHFVDYYLIEAFSLQTSNPLEQSLAEAVVYDTCIPDNQIQGEVYTYGAASQGPLTIDLEIMDFIGAIVTHAYSIRSARINFQNRDLPPTSIPEIPQPTALQSPR